MAAIDRTGKNPWVLVSARKFTTVLASTGVSHFGLEFALSIGRIKRTAFCHLRWKIHQTSGEIDRFGYIQSL